MQYIGELAALTGALFWGMCAIMFESASKKIGPFHTNLIRIVLACILLSGTLFFTSGTFFPQNATMHHYFWLGLSGIVGLAIGDGALFVSLAILGSRRATLLLSLAPPITTVLAWFFLSERLGLIAILGITITVWGIFWVISEKNVSETTHGSKTKGIIYGIIGGTGQAVGLILAKVALRESFDPLAGTLLRMIPACLVLWIYAIIIKDAHTTLTSIKNIKAFWATLGGAVFGPFLGVWLSLVAVKHTETGIASTLMATVPVLIIPMVYFVHKTKPSLRALTGTAIAMVGIVLIFTR